MPPVASWLSNTETRDIVNSVRARCARKSWPGLAKAAFGRQNGLDQGRGAFMRAATSARMALASGTETDALGMALIELSCVSGTGAVCASAWPGAGIAACALVTDR
jgi:hypothetical protein